MIKKITKKTLFIAAGGTGGHIFPALAIAQEYMKKGWKVHWVLSGSLAKKMVHEHGIEFTHIAMTGLQLHTWIEKIKVGMKLIYFTLVSLTIIAKHKPQATIAFGGYTSAPIGLATIIARVPLIIHEQNTVAGKVTKLLTRFANITTTSFEQTRGLSSKNTIHVGNPIRKELLKSIESDTQSSKDGLKILVLGGSQGALSLNNAITTILPKLLLRDSVELVHQCGSSHFSELLSQYQLSGIRQNNNRFRLVDFVNNLASLYNWAHLAVARAGAMTLSELALFGVPVILIPLPTSADNHQLINAQYFQKKGGATVIEETKQTGENLLQAIDTFCDEEGKARLKTMNKLMKQLAKPFATENIILHIEQTLDKSKERYA